MNCSTCKANKIGLKTAPYGGFLCGNEHLQCNDCNLSSEGQCGICDDTTSFVQINFHACFPPSAPPLPLQSDISIADQQASKVFSKQLLAEIEIQPSLYQEQLSMRDSKELLHQYNNNRDGKLIVPKENDTPENCVNKTLSNDVQVPINLVNQESLKNNSDPMAKEQLDNFSPQQKSDMETVFIAAAPVDNSAPNADFSNHNVNDGAFNSMEDNKVKCKNYRRQHNHKAVKKSVLKENIFLFDEDPEDSNIIHTSEIRFMASTDSLKNFYSNHTALGTTTVKPEEMKPDEMKPKTSHMTTHPQITNDVKQQEVLSMNALQSFENHNSDNTGQEVVEYYFKNYGPLACYHFPGYNCRHTCCNFGCEQLQQHMQTVVEPKKTVGVSTDSEPSLRNHDCEGQTLRPNLKPHNYLVMHTQGISHPDSGNMALMDKFGRPSLDMRMQKVLETFREDPRTQKIKEKPLELQTKGNYTKIPSAATNPPQSFTDNAKTSSEAQENQSILNVQSSANAEGLVVLQLLNSHRAFYNPPADELVNNLHTLAQPEPVMQEPPRTQFQIIPCFAAAVQDLVNRKSKFLNNKPMPACMLTIPRTPIKCPESTCQRMIFVSDFNKHLVVDHSHLPMERMQPFQCKSFFLDPHLAHCGISKCHLLYLMRDKISDLGSSQYKDFLPLLVMSSRISLAQMCGLTTEQQPESFSNAQKEFFVFWVTGIVPDEIPIAVSLTVWPRSGKVPSCHVVYSGDMYSIRLSQEVLDVWQSGRMLLLSRQEVDLLTNEGKDMLNLQLMVH